MKVKNIMYYCMALTALVFAGCSELEDKDHYNGDALLNSDEIEIVNMTSEQYLRSVPEYSNMVSLFDSEQVFSTITSKQQMSTILVVANDKFQQPSDNEKTKETKAHVSDISVSPSGLTSLMSSTGLLMWNGKYVDVNMDDEALKNGKIADHIWFKGNAVKKAIRTNDGYIYAIDNMVKIPTSIKDYLDQLGSEYSIMKKAIMENCDTIFDRTNSKKIGVNSQGNTVYDTVNIYKYQHFEDYGLDISSESNNLTFLLPSDEVVTKAIEDARSRMELWDLEKSWKNERQYDFDRTMRNWILDASLYNKRYSADELKGVGADGNVDSTTIYSSIFGKYWMPTKQEVYTDNADTLSNAIVYKVKTLHIPNHVVLYRLKEEFATYQYCTADQKEEWFKAIENIVNFKVNNGEVAAWTPKEKVWPYHQNNTLAFSAPSATDNSQWELDYTLCKRVYNKYYSRQDMIDLSTATSFITTAGETVDSVVPFLVPPGKYRLAFGAKQNVGMDVKFTIYADGIDKPIAESSEITLGTATTYHYDRGTTIDNPRYPEGYDPSTSGYSSKASNYDTDGGLVMNEVVVPDVHHNNSPVKLRFLISCPKWVGASGKTPSMTLNHWCLRPTKDNY